MASQDKLHRAAANAAKKAKAAAITIGRHADKLLKAVRAKAEGAARRRKLKQTLATTGRVLRAAGRAAALAALAAAVAAGRAELRKGKRLKRR
jgi:hypothetical protein